MSTLKIEAEVEAHTRKLLDERLAKLCPEQLAFFHRIYAGGVKKDALLNAIDLCDRTIRKNENGRRASAPEEGS